MDTPLVSIIIPTFNCGMKIGATIASVLSEKGCLYELLVIDGGSTDETLRHLRAQGAAVRWLSEPDAGIYDAMNRGIALATGQFLLFLGAGDRLRPGTLREMAAALPSHLNNLLLYGDVYRCDTRSVYGKSFNKFRLLSENICHQAIFYHRIIFERVGNYRLDFRTCADHEFNIRCFGDPHVRKKYIPLLVSDFEGDGISCSAPDLAFLRAWPGLVRLHFGLFYYLCFILCHSRAGRSLRYRLTLLRGSRLRRQRPRPRNDGVEYAEEPAASSCTDHSIGS